MEKIMTVAYGVKEYAGKIENFINDHVDFSSRDEEVNEESPLTLTYVVSAVTIFLLFCSL